MRVALQCCALFLAISLSSSSRESRQRRLHATRALDASLQETHRRLGGVGRWQQPGQPEAGASSAGETAGAAGERAGASAAGEDAATAEQQAEIQRSEAKVERAQDELSRIAEPDQEEVDPDDIERAILEGDASFWDKIWHRIHKTNQDLKRMPAAMSDLFEANLELLEVLLPGLKARTSSLIGLPIIVLVGVAWITVYFACIYTLDHGEYVRTKQPDSRLREPSGDFGIASWHQWQGTASELALEHHSAWDSTVKAMELEQQEENTNALHCHADMVIVFRHPTYDCKDKDTRITLSILRRIIANRKDTGFFAEFERVLEEHERTTRAATRTDKFRGRLGSLTGLEFVDLTMHEARILVLKDMVTSLPQMGFQVSLFSSVDDDELFLCVSLNREEVMEHYLQREGIELQTTHEVVKRLQVRQDPSDPNSSPPYLRYDKRMVSALHSAKVIEQDDHHMLYRCYHDRDAQGSIMSSRERIRVVQRELTRFLNLEAAKECGVLVDWYPTHSQLWLEKLQSTWCSWSNVTDLSFKQPVPLLREYFGSQMAFSFAWQGVWTKGLLCLSIAAIVVMIFKAIPNFGIVASKSDTIIPEKQIMPYSIITLLWARVVTNLWWREEEFFLALWNQEDGITDQIVRPSFKGRLSKSEVDENIMEENVPNWEKITRKLSSVAITIVCCMFAMVATGAWVHMHHGDLDIIASVWLSLMVKILEFLYNMISAHLVEMENHKFDQDFHDSWVWQQFLFQAVNNYWACVAIAFCQKVSGKCPEGGCFLNLQFQLGMLLAILLGCNISMSLLERLQVWVNAKSEDWYLNQEHNEERSFLEEQCKFSDYNMRAQVENMLQLVIGLGFVLLFGTLQPLIAPLCFIHFSFALRTRAMLLTWHTRRPLPYKLPGIGAWKSVMNTLMNISVFASGVFIVYWGRFFKGGLILAKLSGLVIWLAFVFSLWALVDIIVPRESSDAATMAKRRAHAVRVVTEAAMDVQATNASEESEEDSADEGRSSTPLQSAQRRPRQVHTDPGRGGARSAPSVPGLKASEARTTPGARPPEGLKKNKTLGRTKSLVFMDALSHRAVHLNLGCDVHELAPQRHLVTNEEWDRIPRLSGRLPGGGITRSITGPQSDDENETVP